jgi:hypothetical protein
VFGSGGSSLTVNGNVTVEQGATLGLGCNSTSFPCFDDAMTNGGATLSSTGFVAGNLIATQPLGVVVHSSTVRGNVVESGGGGGVNCGPPDGPPPPGVFGLEGTPVYSDFEDSTVGGNLGVSGLGSCWLGIIRDQVGGNTLVTGNQLDDPDAIEILSNTIAGNLLCQQNSMAWDSNDLTEDLYPRGYDPNDVRGRRVGQCVTAPALTPGGTSPGVF